MSNRNNDRSKAAPRTVERYIPEFEGDIAIELDRLVAWARELNRALIERDGKISDLELLKSDLQQQLASLSREHDKAIVRVKDLSHGLSDRNRKISELELSKNDIQQQLNSIGRERDNLVARDNHLNRAVIDRDEQIVILRDQLDRMLTEKDAEIRHLRRRLNKTLSSRLRRAIGPRRKAAAAIRQTACDLSLPFQRDEASGIDPKEAEVDALRNSGLFDESYYRSAYPDINFLSLDVVKHYSEHGWREGRNPSADFDTRHYLATYSDVRNAQINPLLHFIVAGAAEQRRATRDPSLPPLQDGAPTIDAEVDAIKTSGLFDVAFYCATCPDLHPDDAITHYCEHGWREGRNPSADFDTRHYLATYSDVKNGNVNPFWHYLVKGASEQRQTTRDPSLPPFQDSDAIDAEVEAIKKSGLFDEAFYRAMYPELQPPPVDVIRHYCEHGWREGKNPSDDFDTSSYRAIYADIREANINPLLHYVIGGAAEGRLVGAEARGLGPDAETRYEEEIRFGLVETDIKLIAFYASPEWAGLRSGRPVAKGQSQPPLPHIELGFYDPLDWKTLQRQAEMAKRHGLLGFCFQLDASAEDGARPRPVDLFLAHDDVDFRFCVQIELHAEELSESLAESLVSSLERAMSDDRFIRIQGRAVILVTVSSEAQNAASALGALQKRLTDSEGFAPFLIGRYGCGDDLGLSLIDFWDAVLDQPIAPGSGETGGYSPVDKNGIDAAPYCLVASQGVARARMAQAAAYPVFDCVTLGRDNTSRNPARPLVYTRFQLKEYRRWLDAAIDGARASHPEDRRLLFVNGWNDWNEGLFLEPDRQSGFCRLNETSRALMGIKTGARMPKVTVIVPNYNHEAFLRRRLGSIYKQTYKNIEVILMDDASSDRSRLVLDGYAEYYPDITTTLYNDKNSGGPFRQWAKGIKAATGDLVWIAESDDYSDLRFLETLVGCFEDEAVLLAYSNCRLVDKNEAPVRADFKNYLRDFEGADRWNSSYVATAHNEVKSALGIKNTIPNASGALFRRPVEMPLLDDESWLSMAVAGDWVFYLHLIRGGKIAYSTDTTNFFRRYDGSAAQATYRSEVFYREVATACRTVASLYNVPLAVLDQNRRTYRTMYDKEVGGGQEQFALWFDYQSIVDARESRLPNVMVATMAFYPGGAEILPIRLANEFKRQGLSVLLYSGGFHPREEGVRKMLRNDVPVVETSDVDDLKAIIHDFGVEVLNTHQWHIQKFPLQAPDVFKDLRAHIASLHGMIEHGDAFAVTGEQLGCADQNVTTWVYTAEKNLVPFIDLGLFDKSSPRFVKLPNGMQKPQIVPIPRKHMGIPEDAFVLCCVSRAIPDKGWAEAIRVVEQARALSGRDIRLILVGNGLVYEDYCSTGVPDFVYLAGFSENSVGHYAASDMGIMLTKFKSESFPLTIVDCLFAGKPYIASDVGDIRNMLTTGNGIAGEVIELVEWEIQIEKSAQIVADFATDRQKYAHALSLVQDLVKRYRIDSVAAQYVGLFEADVKKTEAKKAGYIASSPEVLAT